MPDTKYNIPESIKGLLRDKDDEIAALREEIKRLRAKALDWKQWPGEKPAEEGRYLVKVWNNHMYTTHYQEKDEFEPDVTYWAEIPGQEES
jgi:hypothetical protein